MSEARSWFEDEGTLVAALREVGAARDERSAPSIAGYEMLGEIGRGGQGCVWMARQLATRRIVAIKVLADPELATPAARRRLERETEIAAGLDHPGIVRILGGGQTAADEPYLVMEHVDGIPFDRFARSVDRAVPTIVALAAAACDALDEAHRRGVIHRDLKPSNLLVDRAGRVRIVDFGLARAAEVSSTAAATRSGMFVGSLPWASPEQASGQPSRIEIRSDIYSLGVVLFEALTGAMPYAIDGSLAARLHAIESTDAQRPSAFRRELVGDIDAILLTALAKRPADRYATAADFAADLRASLAGEPIRARRESAPAALAKLVRRYRRRAIGATVVAALLLVFAVIALVQRSDAIAARERAERRFTQVRTIASGLLFELDGAVAPLEGSRAARDLIVRSALAYLRDLAPDADEGDAAFLTELASAWERIGDIQGSPLVPNLGDSAAAMASYAEAIRLRERVVEQSPRDAEARVQLARAQSAHGFVELYAGRGDDAIGRFDQALMTLDALGATGTQAAAATRIAIEERRSDALALVGRGDEALAALRRSAALLDTTAAPHDDPAWTTRTRAVLEGKIATTLWELRRPEEALPHAERAVELQRTVSGADPAPAAERALSIELNSLASILVEIGRLERASESLGESLAIRRRALAVDPVNAQARVDLAHVLLRHGALLAKLGDAEAMRAAMEEAIELRRTLSEEAPQNAGRRRAEAIAHALYGQAIESLAGREGLAEESRRTLLLEAAEAIERGAALLDRMATDGLLAPSDQALPATLRESAASLRAKAP